LNPAHKSCNTLHNKALTENTESVLASCLAQIVQKYPDLAQLIQAWPTLPEQVKAKIQRLVEKHSTEGKAK